MAFSKLIAAASAPIMALFLAGCESTTGKTTAEVATTLSSDAAVSLVTYSDWNALPTECAYFGMEDIGKKVDDSCCTASAASKSTVSTSKAGTAYTCFAVDLGGTYAKDFFGCVDGKPTIAEGCVPEATPAYAPLTGVNETAWPTGTLTDNMYSQGDVDSCNCGYVKYSQVTGLQGYSFKNGFPSVYKGPGCFVALNYMHMYVPFLGMNASTAKSTLESQNFSLAFFAHVKGSCV